MNDSKNLEDEIKTLKEIVQKFYYPKHMDKALGKLGELENNINTLKSDLRMQHFFTIVMILLLIVLIFVFIYMFRHWYHVKRRYWCHAKRRSKGDSYVPYKNKVFRNKIVSNTDGEQQTFDRIAKKDFGYFTV